MDPLFVALFALLGFVAATIVAAVAVALSGGWADWSRTPWRPLIVLMIAVVVAVAVAAEAGPAIIVGAVVLGLLIGGVLGFSQSSDEDLYDDDDGLHLPSEAATMIGSLDEQPTMIGSAGSSPVRGGPASGTVVEGRLFIEAGPRSGQVFELRGEASIGRTGDNDIVLPGDGVSRNHARVRRREHGFDLWDVGSTNGTWVNARGRRAQLQDLHVLQDDDLIEIGPYTLRFEQLETGAEAATAPARRRSPGGRASGRGSRPGRGSRRGGVPRMHAPGGGRSRGPRVNFSVLGWLRLRLSRFKPRVGRFRY